MKAITPLFLLSLLFIAPVHAAGNRDACKADAQKLCPGVKPGGGAIMSCLKKNESALTKDCAAFIEVSDTKSKNLIKACAADAKTHCANVKQGQGRVLACLKQNESKLSADCKNQIKPAGK